MNLNPHIFTITLYANMLHLKDRNCQDRYNRKNFSPEKQWTNEGHPSMKLRKQKTCTNESMLGFNLYGVLEEGKLKEWYKSQQLHQGSWLKKGHGRTLGANGCFLEHTFVDSYMNIYIYQNSSNHVFIICIIFIKSS